MGPGLRRHAGPLSVRYDRHPAARRTWARQQTGLADQAPYCTAPGLFPAARMIYAGVRGASLDQTEPALRREVLAKLAAAHAVGVRDRMPLAHLEAAGISAELVPDPAVQVAGLFGDTIRRHLHGDTVADMLRRFPNGHLAVQLSADFGDELSGGTQPPVQASRLTSGPGLIVGDE